jgi:hypothetical protein
LSKVESSTPRTVLSYLLTVNYKLSTAFSLTPDPHFVIIPQDFWAKGILGGDYQSSRDDIGVG